MRTYSTFPAIYELIREVPAGQVASYGMIASLIPGATARIVGFATAAAPTGEGIPWQRVINSQGRISFPAGSDKWQRQKQKLEAEGIVFLGERVPLKQFLW